MSAGAQAAKSQLSQAEIRYKEELRRKRNRTIASYSTLAVCVVFLFYLFTGDRLAEFLDAIGYQTMVDPNSGEYTDCSLPQNQDNRYCLKRSSSADKEWEQIKKRNRYDSGPAPFSLNGR